jgi:hypothetical protein
MRLWIFYLAAAMTALAVHRERYAARRAYAGHGRHAIATITAGRDAQWSAAIRRMRSVPA